MKDQVLSSQTQYRILSLLGEGKNSEVYLAQRSDPSQQLSTFVALKILKSNQLVDVWKREFRSLSQVASKYCVRVIGFEWVMERPALVLEYVEGISLFELLNYRAPSCDQIKELYSQILNGLLQLQTAHLTHGDLSPTNVLLDKFGQVKLVDFGLGNWTEKRRFATPMFTAPEVEQGGEPTFFSDLYSLGKILEFLDGQELKDPQLVERISQLLRPEAANRSYTSCVESQDMKISLGKIVANALEEKNQRVTRTQEYTVTSVAIESVNAPLISYRRNRRRWHYWLAVGATVASFVFLMTYIFWNQPRAVESGGPTGQILLRPEKWREIWVNGERKGYTPLDIGGVKAGTVTIRWKSKETEGTGTLTLAPGENMVLDESFFLEEGK